jgi:hypothetical protein
MKWFLFTFLILLSCSTPSGTQTEAVEVIEDDEFAFARSPSGTNASLDFIEKKVYQQTYQYRVAKSVFDRLIAAKGDFSKRSPTLVISDAVKKVAVAKPRKSEVTLELKAYEACRKMGKDSLNALAVLLGHELIHIYNEHDWKRHFAAAQSDTLDAVKKLKTVKDGLQLELQSDHLGGLLGYAAGFQTLDIMPRLLDTLYNFYPLPKKSNRNYPSLDERKMIAQESMQALQDKIQVFEMAKYLIALEQYEAAKYYLEFILKDFQSRELYNNLGVVCTQAAIQKLDAKALKYGFPIELDGSSRLAKGQTRGDFGWSPEVDELLNLAIDYFKQASLLDENYPPAMLNQACAYTLLSHSEVDHYRRAKFYAEEAEILSTDNTEWSKTKSDVKVILGIIAERQSDSLKAKKYFTEAIEMGNTLAVLNLRILENLPLQVSLGTDEELSMGFADDGGKVRLADFNIDRGVVQLFRGNLDVKNIVSVDEDRKANCGLSVHENSRSYIHAVSREEYAFVQVSEGVSSPLGLDISIGDHYDQLVKVYGQPFRRIETIGGSLLVYYNQALIVEMDEQQKVAKLGVFRYNIK